MPPPRLGAGGHPEALQPNGLGVLDLEHCSAACPGSCGHQDASKHHQPATPQHGGGTLRLPAEAATSRCFGMLCSQCCQLPGKAKWIESGEKLKPDPLNHVAGVQQEGIPTGLPKAKENTEHTWRWPPALGLSTRLYCCSVSLQPLLGDALVRVMSLLQVVPEPSSQRQE